MKPLKTLLIIFFVIQCMFLDLDNLFDWTINKNAYINVFIALLLLLSYFYENKIKQETKEQIN